MICNAPAQDVLILHHPVQCAPSASEQFSLKTLMNSADFTELFKLAPHPGIQFLNDFLQLSLGSDQVLMLVRINS